MVAYNFQKQFVPAIKRHEKTHTIRRNAKRKHAVAGDRLQLYTGMRTKYCAKIIADPLCLGSYPIRITVAAGRVPVVVIETAGVMQWIQRLDLFATDDGFAGVKEFNEFWLGFHGEGLFEGTLIDWGGFSVAWYQPAERTVTEATTKGRDDG